jgi:hypothetical protein
MLEAYGNLDQIMKYYGTPSAPGGHFPFNFRLISDLNNSSSAEDFSRVINEYLERITEGRTANWVVSDANLARQFEVKICRVFSAVLLLRDRLCGLVVRVLGYRSGGPGSIPGTIRKKSSGPGTGSTQPREYN